jgi:hypothetical protein
MAKRFAERHALAVGQITVPIKWENAGTAIRLTTQRGDYLVAPVDQQRTTPRNRIEP